ncbi:MAG: HEPN domain-containing protein [Desulfurococcaceae archaeon]
MVILSKMGFNVVLTDAVNWRYGVARKLPFVKLDVLDENSTLEGVFDVRKEACRPGSYHPALFLAHQAVEKALKAYIIGFKRKLPRGPTT